MVLQGEQQIISKLATGEADATKLIYKQHSSTIINWVKKNGGSIDDARDIFQEAMLILYEHAQKPEFALTCKIGTYLFAISKHLWLKKLNKDNRLPVSAYENLLTQPDKDKHYEDDIKVHEEREMHYDQLGEALNKIGEPCRSLLKAFYNEAKSMQDIAAQFGYTNTDNAKTQKYKCLTRLKKIFFTGLPVKMQQ